ncbi:MAG: MerR family transcriptional regulator [Bacillota bacterium]
MAKEPIMGQVERPRQAVRLVATSNQRNAPDQSPQDTRYVFPMAVVEKLTGLTRRRIRYYEKCGLVTPSRTSGGHRLYSPSNVEALVRIREIIESGITSMEAVGRLLALDKDRGPQPQPAALSMGDAAFRVMRPLAPQIELGRRPETVVNSYFRRADAIPDPDRRRNP